MKILKATMGAAAIVALLSCGGTGTGAVYGSGGLPPGTHLAFIASYTTWQIQSFIINASNGALTAIGSPVGTGKSPYAVSVTPSGKFVYTSNLGDHSVSAFAVNADGSLTALGTAQTLNGPEGMAIDPAGKFLYVACYGSNAICGFTINSDGSLTAIDADPGTPMLNPFPAGNGPASVIVDPQSAFVVVGNYTDHTLGFYSFDATTGMISLLTSPGTGGSPSALAMNAAGTKVFTTEAGGNAVDAFSLNRTAPALTAIGPFASGNGPFALAMDGSGSFLYSANYGGNSVTAFTIQAVGLGYPGGTEVDAPSGLNPAGLATDGPDRILFATCYQGTGVQAYGINSDGSLVALNFTSTFVGPQGIAVF